MALESVPDFKWLTHYAQWDNFPASLRVVCIFNTDAGVTSAQDKEYEQLLRKAVQLNLLKAGINIKVKDIRHTLILDSEESCDRDNEGNWKARLLEKLRANS